MAELRGLGVIQDELKGRGGQLLAISADSATEVHRGAERYKLPFTVLSDVGASVIDAYGLIHAKGGPHGSNIAIPAQVLIDRNGKVVWHRVAKRIQDRPDAGEAIGQIKKLG